MPRELESWIQLEGTKNQPQSPAKGALAAHGTGQYFYILRNALQASLSPHFNDFFSSIFCNLTIVSVISMPSCPESHKGLALDDTEANTSTA